MRYLGIDFGEKRVGVAVSSEDNSLAFPLVVLENNSDLMSELVKMIKLKNITHLIVGKSDDYSGKENKIMEKTHKFVQDIKDLFIDLNIIFEPEFMTSVQASHIQGKNEMLDASAASIILQSYLERIK